MSLYTFIKNKQRRVLSKTWRVKLSTREIEKNNFHVTGNLEKAREFANTVAKYDEQVKMPYNRLTEPIVIFSRQTLSLTY